MEQPFADRSQERPGSGQILIRCFRIAATAVTAIQKQAGHKSGGFQEPEGSAASAKEAAFDV